jgi:hypothetical protein
MIFIEFKLFFFLFLSWYTISSFIINLITPLATPVFFIHHLTANNKMTQKRKVEDQFDSFETLMIILTQRLVEEQNNN